MYLILYESERYPDYELYEFSSALNKTYVNVTKELYERYRRAYTEYNEVQAELAKLERFPIEPSRSRSDMLKELLPSINEMFNAEYEAYAERNTPETLEQEKNK